MKHAEHTTQLARLRRIEGQVKGLIGMIEDERYCVDILTQARAIRAALKKVEGAILQEHVEHCVAGAFESGDRREDDGPRVRDDRRREQRTSSGIRR